RRGDRTVDRERAAVDRRRPGVDIVAGQVQRPGAGLDEAAGPRNRPAERAVVVLIDGQLVGADDDLRIILARQAADHLIRAGDVERPPGAEVELRFRRDDAADADRTAEDVGDALKAVIAEEGQRAGAALVEDA